MKNPAKLERCVRKVKARNVRARRRGKKVARKPYAVCRAAIKRKHGARRKNPATSYVIRVQRPRAKSPVLTWNGHSFSNQPDHIPHKFPTQADATLKAMRLISANTSLDAYKVWVESWGGTASGKGAVRINPSQREKLDAARQKLEDFTGHPATSVERIRARSDERTGLVLGPLKAVEYEATRDGSTDIWRHKFRKGSRPLLTVSTDGKQLHVAGGRYEFTEAGIEDR